MKKPIKIKESDITRIVKRIISERVSDEVQYKDDMLGDVTEREHCEAWDSVYSHSEEGRSIFRKWCCRRGWKCCTRKRPKRNPCWD